MSLADASSRVAAGNLVLWRRNRPIGRKGKKGGQDKGLRCAVPLSPGRRLVSQGFSGLNCDVRRNAAMFLFPGIAGFPRARRTLRAGS